MTKNNKRNNVKKKMNKKIMPKETRSTVSSQSITNIQIYNIQIFIFWLKAASNKFGYSFHLEKVLLFQATHGLMDSTLS